MVASLELEEELEAKGLQEVAGVVRAKGDANSPSG